MTENGDFCAINIRHALGATLRPTGNYASLSATPVIDVASHPVASQPRRRIPEKDRESPDGRNDAVVRQSFSLMLPGKTASIVIQAFTAPPDV
jgi:hypothetical protein